MKSNFNHMKEKLLTDIASGAVMQRPQWKDMLPKIGLAVLIACILALTVLIFTYLFFALRISGVSALLGFGTRGLIFFLANMPWHLIVLDAAFVVAFIHFSKEFAFGWKTPRVPLAVLFVASALSAAWLLDRPINDSLYESRTELPAPLGGLYEEPLPLPEGSGFTHGVILSLDTASGTLSIIDERTGDITDVSMEEYEPEKTLHPFKVGDTVFVAGNEPKEHTMKAFGVRKDMRERMHDTRKEKRDDRHTR